MIAQDIYTFLSSNQTLQTALNATESDSKIYPNYARLSSRLPFIVYQSTNAGGTQDEVLNEEDLTLIITSDTYAATVAISYIITALLDLTEMQIPSATYNIYYAKKIGGNDYADDLGRHVRALNFTFKFNKKPVTVTETDDNTEQNNNDNTEENENSNENNNENE